MLEQVGRYQILKQLGKGAMGVVFLADDPLLNRQVAIKAIDLAVADDASRDFLHGRLLRDARAAASLTHPNIVGIYDVVVEANRACIVMEYVAGEDLAAYLSRNPVPDAKFTIELVRAVAAALDYTHSRGIIHRDIKPANVMLDSTSTPKITDFGIARIAEGATKTVTGMVMGTIEYMAPEQIKGEVVDGRADQFALGVVVYRMLTGATLYGAQSMATMAYKVVNEAPAPVRSRNSTLPAAVDAVVAKVLAKAPDARYRNCVEFAEALSGALTANSIAVAVESPLEVPTRATVTPPPPLPQPVRKSNTSILAVAGTLALVAGAAAGMLWWKPWVKAEPTTEQVKSSTPAGGAAVAALNALPSGAMAPKQSHPDTVQKTAAAVEKTAAKPPLNEPEVAEDAPPVDEIQPEIPAVPAGTPRPAVDALNRGRELMKQRQFADAVQAFNKSIDIRPKWGLLYVNRGSAYQHLEQYTAAMGDYSQAIALNPKLVNAWVGRAQCYVQLKQDNPAFDDFNRAIGLRPNDAVALHGRAWIYLRRKAYRKSLADFNDAIRLEPANVPSYRGRAEVRRALGDSQGAREDQVKFEQLSAKRGS